MPHPLQRGAIVMRGGRYSVVWEVREAQLVLLPIIRPRRDMANDVVLSRAELAACAVPIAGAVIRPRPNPPIATRGHQVVGVLVGSLVCRVTLGVIRAFTDAANDRKWKHERVQLSEHLGDERCVNLLR